MMDHLRVECNMGVTCIDLRKPREIADVDFPIIEFGPSRTTTAWTSVEMAQMGITTELADHMQMQGTDAIDELRFAEIAIDDQVCERFEVLRRDDVCNVRHIRIDTALLRLGARRGGGLCHAEGIGAILGDIDPGEGGNFQALFRPAVGTVPEHIETIGLLAAFGYKTGIEGQNVLVTWWDDLNDGRMIEGNKIKIPCKPSGKGFLMIRTIPAQIPECHTAWQHQHQSD